MSREKFDFSCPGCAPVILDFQTGLRLPTSHPAMQRALKAYNAASHLQRLAWHAVTCNNSRNPLDLALAGEMVDRMQED
jgi:hypothetical protein